MKRRRNWVASILPKFRKKIIPDKKRTIKEAIEKIEAKNQMEFKFYE